MWASSAQALERDSVEACEGNCIEEFYIHCSVHHCNCLKNNNQHDVTCGLSFIFMGSRHLYSTCFELPESSKHVEYKWLLFFKQLQ